MTDKFGIGKRGLKCQREVLPDLPNSLVTGEIPKEWSLANICPLYKKGDSALASIKLSSRLSHLCTFQVTRTHSVLKYHGSSGWI